MLNSLACQKRNAMVVKSWVRTDRSRALTVRVMLDADAAACVSSETLSEADILIFPEEELRDGARATAEVLTVPYLFSRAGQYAEDVVGRGLSSLTDQLGGDTTDIVWIRCAESMPPASQSTTGEDPVFDEVREFLETHDLKLRVAERAQSGAPMIAAGWQALAVANAIRADVGEADLPELMNKVWPNSNCCGQVVGLFEDLSLAERHGYGPFVYRRFVAMVGREDFELFDPPEPLPKRPALLRQLRTILEEALQAEHDHERFEITFAYAGSGEAAGALAQYIKSSGLKPIHSISVVPMTLHAAARYGPDSIIVGWNCS